MNIVVFGSLALIVIRNQRAGVGERVQTAAATTTRHVIRTPKPTFTPRATTGVPVQPAQGATATPAEGPAPTPTLGAAGTVILTPATSPATASHTPSPSATPSR
ncbi:MAG: hypothetical protein GXP41_01415, partial [Chloroflexi bacterium]|nr:hypothetical protein [Chloroflexota bacterium]